MIKFKPIFIAAVAIFAGSACLNAMASYIPEGKYVTPSNLAGYDVIHELIASDSGVLINGSPASEKNPVCSDMLPGGTCQVTVTWNSNRVPATQTISWTSGVRVVPQQFYLHVSDSQGHQRPDLLKVRMK